MNLHPLIVHFPIALLFVGGASYLWFFIRSDSFYFKAGRLAHGIGLGAMLLAILSGRWEKGGVGEASEVSALLNKHELWGYVGFWVLAMIGLWVYLRERQLGDPIGGKVEKAGFCVAYIMGLVVMSIAASFGGDMVYDWGVGTSLFP